MTTLSSELWPGQAIRSISPNVEYVSPVAAPTEADEAAAAGGEYIRMPRSFLRIIFIMIGLLASTVVVAFGLLIAQDISFSNDHDTQNQRITNLGVRVNQLEGEVNVLLARFP